MDKPRADTPAQQQLRLRDALRDARVESAERSSAFHDLQDAEIARLEQLNDAIGPLFEEIPQNIDLFDRGISRGETPRLWIDMIAYIAMDRDHRAYRFIQDTRNGPKILLESSSTTEVIEAITRYIARRIVERERALAATDSKYVPRRARPRRRFWSLLRYVLFAVIVIVGGILATAWIAAGHGL
jgi:hypothetical protein